MLFTTGLFAGFLFRRQLIRLLLDNADAEQLQLVLAFIASLLA